MEENKLPSISIVLPIHNGEDYIEECLERIVNQTFNDFEVIIINDASADSTLEIIEKYAKNDNRLKVSTVVKQKSLADALNLGIAQASGKYIVRIDHDDLMTLDRLEIQFKYMEENPSVVACGGQIEFIDENGNITGSRKYPTDNHTLKNNIFLVSPFAHPAVIMRADILKKVGGYDVGLKKVEDVMLWFRLANIGDFANVPNRVLSYRIRSDSESLSDKYMHFVRTYDVRRMVIKQKIYRIDLRQRILLEGQRIVVNITRILPESWFMKIFEIGRKLVLK